MGGKFYGKDIEKVLKAAYGEDNVDETEIKLFDDERVYYKTFTFYIQKDTESYYSNNHMESVSELCEHTKKGEKCFAFGACSSMENVIFSLEIGDIDENNNHIKFRKCKDVDDKINNTDQKIMRFEVNENIKSTYTVYWVAIKITDKNGNRDYTALKNYIMSADNRTYNKIVRNMIDYVEVEHREIPKNVTKLPHNLLVSGAPGTGKSYFLAEQIIEAGKEIIGEIAESDPSGEAEEIKKRTAEQEYSNRYVTRVTFYEDYSYENFIGCYKPVPLESVAAVEYNGTGGTITEKKITYEYVSGPFVDTYINAKNDPEHNYFLVIEEINRAKAASVFGEMFQLLDRDKDGVSEYDIRPDAALNVYLGEKLNKSENSMRLPGNMYIWATMNSADQGVMPLDSAFKRRWSSMYMDINASTSGHELFIQKSGGEVGKIKWDSLRTKINENILAKGFDEDRCIGPWYFSDTEIDAIKNYYLIEAKQGDDEGDKYYLTSEKERKKKPNPLLDKLFYYLRQDVFRRNPSAIFNDKEDKITMSDLRRRVREGEAVDSILNIDELEWTDVQSVSRDLADQEEISENRTNDISRT